MSAGRLCVREVDVITADESAMVAARRMHSRQVGTLVVVDAETRPIGIITDRDLTIRVLAEGKDAATTSIRDILRGPVTTVDETTPIEDALRIMRAGPFRRVPVVDEDGRLAGLLSLDDVLALLAEELKSIGDLLEAESPSELANV